jgi:hypothetical protein
MREIDPPARNFRRARVDEGCMWNLFDHVGKTIGLSALGPCGTTEMEAVIAPDPRRADLRHEPDPARNAERARIGLLGRIAAIVYIIELYSGAPNDDDAIACLGKLIAFRQQRQREADKKRDALKKRMEKEEPGQEPPAADAFVSPLCWIIAARHPAAALARFAATPATDWPPGVYFGTGALVGAEGVLRMGIVDASELPRDRSTLLVRFMAAGPLLAEAIAELAALEEGVHERTVAEQILVDLEHVLGSKLGTTPEEEEFVMSMQGTWKDARRIGATEARAQDVLTVLRVRGIVMSGEDRERILAEKDPERLERWHERAILATSLAEVFDDESRAA